jgi:MFS family permease
VCLECHSGILPSIQCDLGASDKQGGLLQTAFIVPYVIFSPVVGYLGDRNSRKFVFCNCCALGNDLNGIIYPSDFLCTG